MDRVSHHKLELFRHFVVTTVAVSCHLILKLHLETTLAKSSNTSDHLAYSLVLLVPWFKGRQRKNWVDDILKWCDMTLQQAAHRTQDHVIWKPHSWGKKNSFPASTADCLSNTINYKKLSCCCDSRSYRVQIRSPHTSARTLQSSVSAHALESAVAPNGTVPTHSRRKKRCNFVAVLGRRLASFFVVHFVAKRYILEQKCQKGQIGTLMLGTRWYNF